MLADEFTCVIFVFNVFAEPFCWTSLVNIFKHFISQTFQLNIFGHLHFTNWRASTPRSSSNSHQSGGLHTSLKLAEKSSIKSLIKKKNMNTLTLIRWTGRSSRLNPLVRLLAAVGWRRNARAFGDGEINCRTTQMKSQMEIQMETDWKPN